MEKEEEVFEAVQATPGLVQVSPRFCYECLRAYTLDSLSRERERGLGRCCKRARRGAAMCLWMKASVLSSQDPAAVWQKMAESDVIHFPLLDVRQEPMATVKESKTRVFPDP